MKLELKHLAPYSLYGLKVKLFNNIDIITGIDFENGIIETMNNNNCLTKNLKPVLRPLSYFKGVIVRDIKIELELSHNQVMEFFGFTDGEIKLENITLGLYNAICKKHIDFNKLIEKGLAIDINTL